MNTRISSIGGGAAAPLAVMHRTCFPEDPWDAEALARILRLSGAFGYLAWEGESPAGFVLARHLGEEVEVLSLGVLPTLRRHGIGVALLDAVCAEARRRAAASVVLEVAVGNEAAQRLYRRFGFLQVGRRPRYYRHKDSVEDAAILRSAIDRKPATR